MGATLHAVRFVTGMPGLSRYPPIEPAWAPTMSASDMQRLARGIDDLDYDGLLVPEHIVLPPDLADAMGAHWPHALTAMSFLAGATSRITVISAIVILPLHNPVVLAKEIATLDALSGGRLIVACGVGHAAEEFEALGVRFDQRGRMADEYLEAMSVLWTEEEPSFDGRFARFADIRFEPKPVQKPHPPIWIGGNSPASLRRAARWQGWFPWQVTAADLPSRLAEMRNDPTFGDAGPPLRRDAPGLPRPGGRARSPSARWGRGRSGAAGQCPSRRGRGRRPGRHGGHVDLGAPAGAADTVSRRVSRPARLGGTRGHRPFSLTPWRPLIAASPSRASP